MKKVGIVGAGGIARRLRERLEQELKDRVVFQVRRENSGQFDSLLANHQPDAVFLAISTLDEGQAARDYILACTRESIPVITCEKGALAHYPSTVHKHMSRMGFSAAVGGGTRLLGYVKSRHIAGQRMEIHAVLNGTLNFVFDEMSGGRGLGEACAEAIRLGYAEPGATDPLSLINGELADVVRKACVFFNVALTRSKFLTPKRLGVIRLGGAELDKLARRGADCRFMISFANSPVEKPEFVGDSFNAKVDGWRVFGGFRRIYISETSWLPRGVGNAVHIVEGELGKGGKYTLSGPGAGHEPTTSAMLADFNALCP